MGGKGARHFWHLGAPDVKNVSNVYHDLAWSTGAPLVTLPKHGGLHCKKRVAVLASPAGMSLTGKN
jgi:hypothetical protein